MLEMSDNKMFVYKQCNYYQLRTPRDFQMSAERYIAGAYCSIHDATRIVARPCT